MRKSILGDMCSVAEAQVALFGKKKDEASPMRNSSRGEALYLFPSCRPTVLYDNKTRECSLCCQNIGSCRTRRRTTLRPRKNSRIQMALTLGVALENVFSRSMFHENDEGRDETEVSRRPRGTFVECHILVNPIFSVVML